MQHKYYANIHQIALFSNNDKITEICTVSIQALPNTFMYTSIPPTPTNQHISTLPSSWKLLWAAVKFVDVEPMDTVDWVLNEN